MYTFFGAAIYLSRTAVSKSIICIHPLYCTLSDIVPDFDLESNNNLSEDVFLTTNCKNVIMIKF